MVIDISLIYNQDCKLSQLAQREILALLKKFPQYSFELIPYDPLHPLIRTLRICITPTVVVKESRILVGLPSQDIILQYLNSSYAPNNTIGIADRGSKSRYANKTLVSKSK